MAASSPHADATRWLALLLLTWLAVVAALWSGASPWLLGVVAIVVTFGGGRLLRPR